MADTSHTLERIAVAWERYHASPSSGDFATILREMARDLRAAEQSPTAPSDDEKKRWAYFAELVEWCRLISKREDLPENVRNAARMWHRDAHAYFPAPPAPTREGDGQAGRGADTEPAQDGGTSSHPSFIAAETHTSALGTCGGISASPDTREESPALIHSSAQAGRSDGVTREQTAAEQPEDHAARSGKAHDAADPGPSLSQPPAGTGVRPPADLCGHQYHWLSAERVTEPCMSEWINGEWWSAGEEAPITPEKMQRRGWEYWEYMAPAYPPPPAPTTGGGAQLLPCPLSAFRAELAPLSSLDGTYVQAATQQILAAIEKVWNLYRRPASTAEQAGGAQVEHDLSAQYRTHALAGNIKNVWADKLCDELERRRLLANEDHETIAKYVGEVERLKATEIVIANRWDDERRAALKVETGLRVEVERLTRERDEARDKLGVWDEGCHDAYAEQVVRAETAEAALARLEGRLCLICGAKEPCELSKDEMSPCTFDPSPIEAAQRFHKEAVEAKAALARAQKVAEAQQPLIDFLIHAQDHDRVMSPTLDDMVRSYRYLNRVPRSRA